MAANRPVSYLHRIGLRYLESRILESTLKKKVANIFLQNLCNQRKYTVPTVPVFTVKNHTLHNSQFLKNGYATTESLPSQNSPGTTAPSPFPENMYVSIQRFSAVYVVKMYINVPRKLNRKYNKRS